MAARFGAVRDQVLGLTVVNGDGRITQCGGRVVKNVTGYDLCRLYTGSGGGLGILVEATVRVRPAPERVLRIEAELPAWSEAFDKAWSVRNRVPEIASIQIRGGSGPERTVVAIAAGLGSFVEAAAAEIRAALGRSVREAPGDARSFRIIAAPQGRPRRHDRGAAGARGASSPPSSIRCSRRSSEACTTCCAASASRGMRRIVPVSRRARARRAPREVRRDARPARRPGFCGDAPRRFPSQRPGGLELMRSLKAALDPAGILNPGMTVFG